MEPFTFFISPIVTFGTYLYLAISGKDFNPMLYFNVLEKEERGKIYSLYHLDLIRFKKLKEEVEEITKEIEEEERAITLAIQDRTRAL